MLRLFLSASSLNQIAQDMSGNYFKIDANNDGEIQVSEAQQTSFLNISYSNISNINGIEFFTSLNDLEVSNNQLTIINLTGLNNLIYFKCNYNNLTTFNVSNLPNLGLIQVAHNQLTSLSISNLQILNTLDCSFNQLPSLTLVNLPNTLNLNCNNNLITTLDLNSVTGLYSLTCNYNLLTSLFVKVIQFFFINKKRKSV